MKTCTRCGTTKPLDDFHRDRKAKDGRVGACRDCARTKDALRRGASGPRIRAATGCNYGTCRAPIAVHSSGLCARHHAYLAACHESPLALTGGEWVVGRGGVRRWVA